MKLTERKEEASCDSGNNRNIARVWKNRLSYYVVTYVYINE
jgi:hypothetical protein